MTLMQALILGLVQGLTEFLPISSSGHLVLGQKLLGFSQPPVLFDILVHVGTLTAVIIFFHRTLSLLIRRTWGFLANRGKLPKKVIFIVVGTIPAAIVGFFLNSYLAIIFDSVALVGMALIVNSVLLFSTTLIKKSGKKLSKMTWQDALIVGILQALAILPGMSRSGSTVVAGLWRNLKREMAFTFSFLLSIPAILGAMSLQLGDLKGITSDQVFPNMIGFASAAFSGYLALILFKKAVMKGKLAYFGIYCGLFGLIILLFF